MRLLRRIRGNLEYLVRRNIDLIGVWFALMVIQNFVPPTTMLARDDLLPWLAVTLSAIALLRGRLLGAGPHPMLTRRRPTMSGWMHMAALAVTPWAILAVHDVARTWEMADLGLAGGLLVAVAILMGLSWGYDRTAWRPRPNRGWLTWGLGILFIGSVAVLTGLGRRYLPADPEVVAVSSGVLLGMFFVAIGWAAGRYQNHAQRVRAGRKDDRPYRPQVFPSLLAVTGPSVGLAVLLMVLPGLDFRFAFAASLLAVVWAAVIWPKRVPVAVTCLLHEVVPVGGQDKPSADSAKPFEKPPEGALRFNPIKTKRTRVMHAWYVPVQASRIADLDDPVKPLWPTQNLAVPYHILGEAAFEPDPRTKGPQWDVITVRMKSQDDTVSFADSGGGADAKTRRMVILRPFARPGLFSRPMLRTYRWDPRVPREAVQVLDDTTEVAVLKDGDVLLMSIEGVAHAYEVEIGSPIYQAPGSLNARPPQLGDYVAL